MNDVKVNSASLALFAHYIFNDTESAAIGETCLGGGKFMIRLLYFGEMRWRGRRGRRRGKQRWHSPSCWMRQTAPVLAQCAQTHRRKTIPEAGVVGGHRCSVKRQDHPAHTRDLFSVSYQS